MHKGNAKLSPTMQRWLATRPASVKQLAREFPPGTTFLINDVTMWVVGYTENDHLIVSHIDPHENYQEATKQRSMICADHLRGEPHEH